MLDCLSVLQYIKLNVNIYAISDDASRQTRKFPHHFFQLLNLLSGSGEVSEEILRHSGSSVLLAHR